MIAFISRSLIFHSRKSIIENRCLIGIGERNGGNRSASLTQDVGKERRRRQRREGTVVDGGLGVESSVEMGKVRFEVAAIENKSNKDSVSAVVDSKLNTDFESNDFYVHFASIDKGIDKTVHFVGIDKDKFMLTVLREV